MKQSYIYIATLIYFVGLVSFEAAQQHYYITSFDLAGKDEVTIIGLMSRHSIRWAIWVVLALPLARFVFRHPARQLDSRLLASYGMGLALTLLATLLVISGVELWSNELSADYFGELLAYFTYQKAALFFNAYLGLIILISLYQRTKLLDSKMVELTDLKIEFKSRYDELSNQIRDDHAPLIQIKVGNKVKNILLADILWVQSDDYCVKVHAKSGSYNLRKSMKLMEQELEPWGFIRLHRNTLVNRDEVDTLVYAPEPGVTLKNGQTLPIALGRVSKVKEHFKGYLGLPA